MSPKSARIAFIVSIAILLLGLVSCGSDGNGTGPGPGSTGSADIGPSGGVVQSRDGAFKVTVPAGALATTETISIETMDPVDLPVTFDGLSVEAAYSLQPDGLTFTAPVAIEFTSDQSPFTAPGEVALVPEAIFTQDSGGALEKLANAEMVADEGAGSVLITGETTHFSPFVCVSDRDLETGDPRLHARFVYTRETDATRFDITATLTWNQSSYATIPIEFANETDSQDATAAGGGSYFFQGIDLAAGDPASHTMTFGCAREGAFDARVRLSFDSSFTGQDHLRVRLEADCPGPDEPDVAEPFSIATGPQPELSRTFQLTSKEWDDTPEGGFDYLLSSGSFGTRIYDLNLRAPAFNVASPPGIGAYFGAIPLAFSGSNEDFTSGFLNFGNSGGLWKQYSAESGFNNSGLAFSFQSYIWDAQVDGDDPDGGRASYVYGGTEVRFLQLDGPSSLNSVGQPIFGSSLDKGQAGPIVGALRTTFAFRGGVLNDVLLVTSGTEGTGKIFQASTSNPSAPVTSVGSVGSDPRRLRYSNGVAAVSNFGSDDLTIMTWNGSTVTVTEASVSVGDGPVGIDLIELSNGNIAISSSGFNDDTYSITIVDASGNLVSSDSFAVPLGGDAPGHATWTRRGEEIWMVVSCNASNEVILIPTEL